MTEVGKTVLFGIDDPTHKGDPDGLIAIAGLGALPDQVELIGLVVNGAPARRRAMQARYALDRHGARTPIGIGEEIGTAREAELAASPFEAHPGSESGYELSERVLANRDPGSLRGFFTSPFREAAWLIDQPHLWRAFERVAIMGGVARTRDGWKPDSAFNNRQDRSSAERFYGRLLASGTPVTLVDRRFALWAKIPKAIWTNAEAAGWRDPWAGEIGTAVRRQWERMWAGVRSGQLPRDRTAEWYLDNWCDGARPDWYQDWTQGRRRELPAPAAISAHVTGAPAYDVLAVATLLDDQPLGLVETHPAYPEFHVLRPDAAGPERAVEAQQRLIDAALTSPAG